MVVRSSSLLAAGIIASAFALGLAGCDRRAEAAPEPPAAATKATPDPAAPAPGTQAAEAIGADSSSNAPMAPPEKQPH